MLKLSLFAVTFLLASTVLRTGVRAQEVSGTYTLPSDQGALTLTLQPAADGTTGGTLVGFDGTRYEVYGQPHGDELVGVIASPQGRGGFQTYLDPQTGQRLFVVIPMDADGNLQTDDTVAFPMQPQAATAATPAAHTVPNAMPQAPAAVDGTRDPQLVGTWSHQEIMSDPNFGSLTTQMVVELRPDGVMVEYDGRMVGGGAGWGAEMGSNGVADTGEWRTENGVLFARQAGTRWVALARYYVEGGRALLTFGDGSRQVWYRR